MSLSSKKLVKVKRIKVNWFFWLWFLAHDYDEFRLLNDFSKMLKSSKVKSVNRISYNVLKKYYSTTAIGSMRFLYRELIDLNKDSIYELLQSSSSR